MREDTDRKVTQPIITKTEINKGEKHVKEVQVDGWKAWKGVKNSNTTGQGQIVMSYKTGRTHILYSRGEKLPFYTFERQPNVIDIFDQFPLPLDKTMEIAIRENIRHPGSYKERHKHGGKIPAKTMTTDLVLVVKRPDGKKSLVAVNFKYSEALSQDNRNYRRTREKIRIEELYWGSIGVKFLSVTEKDFSKTVMHNLIWLRQCYLHTEVLALDPVIRSSVNKQLLHYFHQYPSRTLKQHCQAVAYELNLTYEQVVILFQYDVYEYRLPINLEERIELYLSVPLHLEEEVCAC